MNVVAPPLKGTGKNKKVKYDDLLLFPPEGTQKSQQERRADYEDIMRHVRGRSHRLGRGKKSEKTIAEIWRERRNGSGESKG